MLFIRLPLVTLVLVLRWYFADSQSICQVFQPYRIAPDDAKFNVGGIFPLHKNDCKTIRPDAVQELVAVQWALSHWNQDPGHHELKTAFSASDSCSRANVSVSLLLSYLEEVGRFSAQNCPTQKQSRPLGFLLPPDGKSARVLSDALNTFNVPAVAYTLEAAEGHLNAISVSPRLDHFVKVIADLFKTLSINYVSISTEGHLKRFFGKRAKELFANLGTVTEKVIDLDMPRVHTELFGTSASAMVFFARKNKIRELVNSQLVSSNRFIIFIPTDGETFTTQELFTLSQRKISSIVLILQTRPVTIPNFRKYFLEILRNNFESHPVFGAYYHSFCSQDDCNLNKVESNFKQSAKVDKLILGTYVFAALAKSLEKFGKDGFCQGENVESCANFEQILQSITYEFGDYDPSGIGGSEISLDGHRTLKGLKIDGYQILNDYRVQENMIKIIESSTGHLNVVKDTKIIWPDSMIPFVSKCPSYKPECQHCSKLFESERLVMHAHGDIYLVGLFDWHLAKADLERTGEGTECGSIASPRSISGPLSFLYALNSASVDLNFLPGVKVGSLLLDSCQRAPIALREMSNLDLKCLLTSHKELHGNVTVHPKLVAGYMTGLPYDSFAVLKDLFTVHGLQAPMGAAVPAHLPSPYHAFSNYPTFGTQSKALVQCLDKFGWNFVTAVVSEHDLESTEAFKSFKSLAEKAGICISNVFPLHGHRNTIEFFKKSQSADESTARVVLMFTTAEDTAVYVRIHSEIASAKASDGGVTLEPPIFVLVGDAHNWETQLHRPETEKWHSNFENSFSLQPQLPESSRAFETFLENIGPQKLSDPWFLDFWEEHFECSLPNRVQKFSRVCEGSEIFPRYRLGRLTKENYMMHSTKHLLKALDGLYRKYCTSLTGLCEGFYKHYFEELKGAIESIERRTEFVLYHYPNAQSGFLEVGNWSEQSELSVDEKFTRIMVGRLPKSACKPPLCRCQLSADFLKRPVHYDFAPLKAVSFQNGDFIRENGHEIVRVGEKRGSWQEKKWTYIFIVVITLCLVVALAVLGLILAKIYQRVIQGNQSLGICLLAAVILLYATAYFFIFDPSEIICRLRYILHSSAYVICFGVMVAKGVQLKNSAKLGCTEAVSYWNYWLLLIFICGVQIALNVQWAFFKKPILITLVSESGALSPICAYDSVEFLVGQVYALILLLLALFIAVSVRNIKRNYKEARWLLYTAGVCLSLWVLWMIAYPFTPVEFQGSLIVMQLVTCATVILCFMFGPKVYILLSYEPVLVQCKPSTSGSPSPDGSPHSYRFEDDENMYSANENPGKLRKFNLDPGLAHQLEDDESGFVATVVRKKTRSKRGARKLEKTDSGKHSQSLSEECNAKLEGLHMSAYVANENV